MCVATFCNITSCSFTLCSNIPIAIIPVVLYLIVVAEFSTVAVALPPIVVELRFILLALGVAVVSAIVVAFRRRRWFAPGRR